MRETYLELMADPAKIEAILLKGAAKARQIATPFMGRLRQAVGLRDLRAQVSSKAAKAARASKPLFKQYRESDGRFYFKLLDAQGELLLQSTGFDSPRDAGQAIRLLQTEGETALGSLASHLRSDPPFDARKIFATLQAMNDVD